MYLVSGGHDTFGPVTISSCVQPLQVIGNGSFGVVYQARLIDSQEMVAIKKVLQDKRFKVGLSSADGHVIQTCVHMFSPVCQSSSRA